MTMADTQRDAVGSVDSVGSTGEAEQLLHSYRPAEDVYDELVDPSGRRRSHWAPIAESLDRLSPTQLANRRDEARRLLDDDGVSYHPATRRAAAKNATIDTVDGLDDSWKLDPLPAIIGGEEWSTLEAAIAQRSRLLDLVLADLYGPRHLISRGLIPPEVVFGHPGFLRACDGIKLPGPHQLFLSATDLARDRHGRRVVLADRAQAPSGAAYALENRTVISRVLPDIYRDNEIQRLAPFFRTLRDSLRRIAPPNTDSPRIVVLSPGPRSETAFEHALLAANLGCALVRGTDLRVRDGHVWMRTLGRLAQVHVILRRVDANFSDPLELRPDSHLGVPGLLEACRLGNVSVVNSLGSGALENPGLMSFLPSLAEALLGEPLALDSVSTWWCGDGSSLSHTLANLHDLVLRPLGGTASDNILGWELDSNGLDEMRRRLATEPDGWVSEERLELSSTPTLVDNRLEARGAVLRTFAVSAEDDYRVMPGGLTRVAIGSRPNLPSNHSGALSKDTWVLSDEPELTTGFWLQSGPAIEAVPPEAATSERAAENLFWLARYAERTESVARLLRVVSDRRTEFASGTSIAGDACVELLLSTLTAVSGTRPGFIGDQGAGLRSAPGEELRSLVRDHRRTGSLAYNVGRMLETASEVRDQLSGDTWLVIGHLDRDLAAHGAGFATSATQSVLASVMQAMLALSGLSAESMVRDPGWQFMEIGRRIERSAQLCTLLDATVVSHNDTATDSLVLESTLMAAESIITYRRRYRGRARIETVLDLLLLDRANPRSLAYQLDRLDEQLSTLPGASSRPQRTAARLTTEALARVLEVNTSDLAAVGPNGARGALRTFLLDLGDGLRAAAASIESDHFTRQLPQLTVFTPNDPGRQ